jgi:uncharacterized membrane protein
MDDLAALALARALHVLAVVVWIGGVALITMVALPAIRRGDLGADWPAAFQALERRFSLYAKIAVLVAGASGLYMVWRLNLWGRFHDPFYWWMHAMTVVWLLFAFILFIAEPLVAHRRFDAWAKANPTHAFAWLQRGHWLLLSLAVIAILGAVAGSHGWSPF